MVCGSRQRLSGRGEQSRGCCDEPAQTGGSAGGGGDKASPSPAHQTSCSVNSLQTQLSPLHRHPSGGKAEPAISLPGPPPGARCTPGPAAPRPGAHPDFSLSTPFAQSPGPRGCGHSGSEMMSQACSTASGQREHRAGVKSSTARRLGDCSAACPRGHLGEHGPPGISRC